MKDQILALMEKALETARKQLEETQTIKPGFWLLHEGEPEYMPVPGFLMESSQAKSILFKATGMYAKQTGALGIVFIADTFMLEPVKPFANKEEGEQYLEATRSLGVRAAAAKGLGRMTEALNCFGQIKGWCCMMTQAYTRVAPDGVIPPSADPAGPHTIRFNAPATRTTEDHGFGGRLGEMFDFL